MRNHKSSRLSFRGNSREALAVRGEALAVCETTKILGLRWTEGSGCLVPGTLFLHSLIASFRPSLRSESQVWLRHLLGAGNRERI